MTDEPTPKALQETFNDRAAKFLRATLGNMPVGGAFVTELVGVIIPNLREERIVRFLARLAAKLQATEATLEALRADMDAQKASLIEDGAMGAARATADERIEQLADLVAQGLMGTTREAEDQRAVVRLLNDLTEADVRYLMLRTKTYGDDKAWLEANGYNCHWEQREGAWINTGHSMDGLVEMHIQGRLIANGLFERKLSLKRSELNGHEIDEDPEVSFYGLDLLRRLGLLQAGQS